MRRGVRARWTASLALIVLLASAWTVPASAAGTGLQEIVAFGAASRSLTPQASSATLALNQLKLARAASLGLELGGSSEFLERPLALEQVRETDHFRIHFTADAADAPHGWPASDAYLRAAEAACEQAWHVYHELQGWPLPPPAQDSDRTDIYIVDLGWGVYGYALHEDLADRAGHAGFIVVDNDFAGFGVDDPLQALAVTLAHEYHHVIQFGFGYDPEASWFMEQTATMEETTVVWRPQEVASYLEAYGARMFQRLDAANGYFEYGAWLWPRFIAERWGWETLIEIWRRWEGGAMPMLAAQAQVLAELEADAIQPLETSRADVDALDAAILEWATRNALLGAERRVAGHEHEHGAELPNVAAREWTLDRFPRAGLRPPHTRQPEPMGACCIELLPQPGSADNTLRIEIEACPGLAGIRLVVFDSREAPAVTTGRIAGNRCVLEVHEWQRAQRALIVLTNSHDAPTACEFALSASTSFVPRTSAGVDPNPDPLAATWLQAAPNPFEPYTVFHYELPIDADIQLRLFDAQGRIVRTLFSGPMSAGHHAVYWDGQAAGGARAAAGVYYGRLESSFGARELRVVRIR